MAKINKNTNELRTYIDAWKSSQKYLEFKKELEEKIKQISSTLDSTIEHTKKIIMGQTIDKKAVEESINSMFEFFELKDNEKEEYQILTFQLCSGKNKEFIISDYTQTIIMWHIYLVYFEQKQEFELCAKIIKVLALERSEIENTLTYVYTYTEVECYMLDEIEKQVKAKFFPQC